MSHLPFHRFYNQTSMYSEELKIGLSKKQSICMMIVGIQIQAKNYW